MLITLDTKDIGEAISAAPGSIIKYTSDEKFFFSSSEIILA